MLGSEVLAFDYRYSPVNPRECRLYWCTVLLYLLDECDKGCLKVGFVAIYFKIKKITEDQNMLLVRFKKQNITLFRKDARRLDLLYLFYIFLSYLPLPKPTRQTSFVFSKPMDIMPYLNVVNSPRFQPDNWVKKVLFLLFPNVNKRSHHILPLIEKNDPWIEWLKEKSLGRKRFFFHHWSILLIRTEESLTLHMFYQSGEHLTYSLPRTKKTYQDLYVLFRLEKRPPFFCSNVSRVYKSYRCPVFVEILRF